MAIAALESQADACPALMLAPNPFHRVSSLLDAATADSRTHHLSCSHRQVDALDWPSGLQAMVLAADPEILELFFEL